MRLFLILTIFFLQSCHEEKLHVVTVDEFNQFVEETNYITDAEKFKWSFVQKDVYNFEVVENVNWKNNENTQDHHLPVTQVSYNDALAFARWSETTIPDYDTYWKLVKSEKGMINQNSTRILPKDQCHIIGNVWEITQPDNQGRIRLAGGSYLCSPNSCNGTVPERELFVDSITANSHIGFAVIKKVKN